MKIDTDDACRIILEVIQQIPRGKVSTYGAIAQLSGFIGRARLVGTALRNSPPRRKLPWHRVVNAQGKVSFRRSEHYAIQKTLLVKEGITFKGDKIDLSKYGWNP